MSDKGKEFAWLNVLINSMEKVHGDYYAFYMKEDDINKLKQLYQRLIQRKPEIDNMEEYVEEKERELFDAIIMAETIEGAFDKHFSSSRKIGIEKRKAFIRRVVSNVKGREAEVDMNFLIKWQRKISKGSGGGHVSLSLMKKMLEAAGVEGKPISKENLKISEAKTKEK